MACMKKELVKSGLGEEEILAKTKAVMKVGHSTGLSNAMRR